MSALAALVAATTMPPDNLDALLEAFAVMSAARQVILEGLTEPIAVTTAEARMQLDLLRERHVAWAIALAAASANVETLRVNARKLRGYVV